MLAEQLLENDWRAVKKAGVLVVTRLLLTVEAIFRNRLFFVVHFPFTPVSALLIKFEIPIIFCDRLLCS